jgi:hypothetical protein
MIMSSAKDALIFVKFNFFLRKYYVGQIFSFIEYDVLAIIKIKNNVVVRIIFDTT